MGQNVSSRIGSRSSRRHSSTPTIVVSPPALDEDSTPQDTTTAAASSKRSRRSSVRDSLLSLVTPGSQSSARSPMDSTASSTTASSNTSRSRRRWRTSRRWSKTPADSPDSPVEDAQDPLPPPSENPIEESEVTPVQPPNGKGKEKEDLSHRAESAECTKSDRPPTPFPVSTSGPSSAIEEKEPLDLGASTGLSSADQATSSNIGTWLGGQGQLAQRLGISGSGDDEVVISPSSEPDASHSSDRETTSQIPPIYPAPLPSSDLPPSPLQQTRPFPPPGTLVVVQGVVHTTDVAPMPAAPSSDPEPNSTTDGSPSNSNATPTPRYGLIRRTSSARRSSTPTMERSGRNRLSALISRPPSMRSSRHSSRVREDVNANAPPNYSTVPDSSPETEASSNSDSDNSASSGDSTPATNESDTGTTPSENNARIGALSPSSIDVLGTLLSVAAAATAASLLTGSSDPIFSSGLTPPSGHNPIPRHPTPSPSPPPGFQSNTNRPMSPTPTAGLGGIGFGGLGLRGDSETPGHPANFVSHGGSRERVSRAWGNLRERLGLRGPTPGGNPHDMGMGGRVRTRPDGIPMNARELMLAEMARAFNLGLGLNNNGVGADGSSAANNINRPSSPASQTPMTAEAEGLDPILPPEDSFERFLINLQADLRVALSGDPLPPASTANAGAQGTVPTTALPSDPAGEPPVSAGDAAPSPTGAPEVHVSHTNLADRTGQNGDVAPFEDDATDDEMPALADVSDSEEGDEGDEESERPEAPEHGDVPPPLFTRPSYSRPPDAENPTLGSEFRTERRPGGGINWWRLYRFPSITAPQAQGLSATLNNNTNGMRSAASPAPAFDPTHMSSPSSTSSATPPLTQTATEPGPPTTVVPVIIVGLQTVGRRHNDSPMPGGHHQDVFPEDEADFAGDADFGSPLEDIQGGRRGRTWQSRAASAIRHLRPGRRLGSRAPPEGEGVGSRTFLIYVIGGYYPPDHTILSGANTLNSFEALWELAELFGNHKPPTVSKEDIEKSGLEIIKSSELDRYEKDGKVSNNCVDKCLICLDDYEPEDDVRLMKCKHAFHKNCVDKWLETGRNNCPACRSTGVGSTDGPPPAAQAFPQI